MSFDYNRFIKFADKHSVVAKSPGRINLIGEHTDYNNGFVLPAAINKAVYVSVRKSNDRQVKVISNVFEQQLSMPLDNLTISELKWANYVFGVADQLMKNNYPIDGFELILDGDIPIGAGLSSSAAVECATIFALNELFQLNITRLEMAKLTQMAEHTFAGVRCGIMDMYASLFGKKGHVIRLDCKTLESEYFPFDFEGYSILLMDTQIKHSLASSEYNLRREQCEKGVSAIQKKYPAVNSLRDATMQMFNETINKDDIVYRRCKYVIEENERLLSGCDDLKRSDIKAFGNKMFATHVGLSKEYEVSCSEMNFLVAEALADNNIAGSRMMGGGFGGCTVNLIKTNAVDDFINKTNASYFFQFGSYPQPIMIEIEDGTKLIDFNNV